MRNIEAVLLPTEEGAEPTPVSVGDLQTLRDLVGGHIDAVQVEYNTDELPIKFSDDYLSCRVVGYLNDEGLLLGLPMNKLATLVFGRPLFGPVVLVGGDDGGGNDTPLPEWFLRNIYSGALQETVKELDESAKVLATAVKFGIEDGAIDADLARALVGSLMGDDESEAQTAQEIIEGLVKYYISRKLGMERPDWDAIDEEIIEEERLIAEFDPSDEDIHNWIGGE